MKKRILSLAVCLLLTLSLLPISAFAALPNGYWPYLEAYLAALESGDEEKILSTGDAYLNFLSKYERNKEIGENQYNIYNKRLELEIFEKRGDWDNAIKNVKSLLEASQYLDGIGVDRKDMIRYCNVHLGVLQPFVGVYAASFTQNRTYGSAVAPASGVLYGSLAEGYYGERSICSFYIEVERETARQFDYLIDPKANGERAILINLNFKGEAATVGAIPNGTYDANIRETLNYLATLQCPVLLRVGGEMDLWSKPAEFKAAYNHVAAMARELAPKVELVWSPNFVSGWDTNVEDFYPGDGVVDWVGVSLYYNYNANGSNNTPAWIEYTHAKQFADPVASGERVFSIAKAHNKPAIVTEGGVHRSNGEAYAAAKAAKEFSTLTMVYPQVKAIVYFDKKANGNDYTLTGSVRAAVDSAVAANPTLLGPGETRGATFVPVETLNERMEGTLILGATGRTYHNSDMSAVWKLDGKATQCSGSPNQLPVNLSTLAAGKHKLEIALSDGQKTTISKTYTLDYTNGTVKITEGYTAPAPNPTPNPAPAASVAYRSTQSVSLDGEPISLPAYALKDAAGNSTNYVRVRDLALFLSGTAAQFNVGWDGAINLESHTVYVQNGSELEVPFSGDRAYQDNTAPIKLDGTEVPLKGIVLKDDSGNGYTYFKLRDLGRALNFNVGWTAERGMFIETDKPYTDAD